MEIELHPHFLVGAISNVNYMKCRAPFDMWDVGNRSELICGKIRVHRWNVQRMPDYSTVEWEASFGKY